jgi:hypothetical protein
MRVFDIAAFCKSLYGETATEIIYRIEQKERELDGWERAERKKKKSATFYPYKAKGDKEALGRLAYVIHHGSGAFNTSDDEWKMFSEVWRRMKKPASQPQS